MDARFTACQTVDLVVPEEPISIQHYLRQPKRVVEALTASSRIDPLGPDYYRLKMRPLTFMMFTIQPTVDMRVWSEAGSTIRLQSVDCEIRGFEYANQRFSFDLSGQLYPEERQGHTYLKGQADLAVQVALPPPLIFTPRPIIEATGNGLLASVLLSIKQRLMHHLLHDYRQWVHQHDEATVAAYRFPSVPLPEQPPAV